MRPLVILFSIVVFLGVSSCADNLSEIQKETFLKYYGSYQADQGMQVNVLPGGGYAVVGSIVPDSLAKMVLLLLDEYGNQTMNSPNYYGEDTVITNGKALLTLDDGFVVAGTVTEDLGGGESQTDIFLVRTDAAGNPLWMNTYGGSEDDDVSDLIVRKEGGFVIAGKRTTDEQDDMWVFMIDDIDGSILYEKQGSDFDDDDQANCLLATPSGYLCAATYDDIEKEGTDLFIILLDEECKEKSSRAYGDDDDEFVTSLVRYQDGYIVAGYVDNTTDGELQIVYQQFTIQNNTILTPKNIKTVAGTTDNTCEDAVITRDGNIALWGTTETNENRDMLLIILNSDGVEVDRKVYGALGNQTGSSIAATPDGGLIMTGTNGLEGNSVITIMKTTASGEF